MHGLVLGFCGFLVRILFCIIFYGTPLLGFWLASSLEAYLGGPPYLAWTAGLLLFPIIPGFWELYTYSHRRSDAKPFLTFLDRLSLRTFAVGLVFMGVLLYLYPQTAFVSLSTRGDWMLDNVKDARADKARRFLFEAAGGLEWLYRATRANPYKEHIDPKAQQLAQEATHEATQQVQQDATQEDEKNLAQQQLQQSIQQDEKMLAQQRLLAQEAAKEVVLQKKQKASQKDEKKLAQQEQLAQKAAQEVARQQQEVTRQQQELAQQQQEAARQGEKKWPWKRSRTLHRAVAKMPPEVETSIESVAKYIAKQEKDPVLRIKALHDYVADRIAYDAESYFAGRYPDQSAETTFKTRKSVCAGYANLLSALASAIDEKIIVVCGDARGSEDNDKLTGSSHAWNAACIGKQWCLIDACWDSGTVSREKGFTKAYRTDYLLPPPEVMIQNHYPEEKTWQLLSKPLSQGDFLRQPMLDPSFQAAELTLIAPRRARNEVGSMAVVILRNPKKQWVMAGLEQSGKEVGNSSTSTNDGTPRFEWTLSDKGTYRLNMFINEKEFGSYSYVGSVDFVNR